MNRPIHQLFTETITTEHLLLRPMCESDATLVVAWRTRPEDSHSFLSDQLITLESHLKWFRSARHGRLDYIMERRSDCRCIGTLHFKNIDLRVGSAESGRLIGDLDCRGQGYGRESAIAWFRFGFDKLALKRIYGVTSAENAANLALNTSLGATVDAHGTVAGLPTGFVRSVLSIEAARSSGLFWPISESSQPEQKTQAVGDLILNR
jgi:RimJ/RimL family protein N-acetyltransferase